MIAPIININTILADNINKSIAVEISAIRAITA